MLDGGVAPSVNMNASTVQTQRRESPRAKRRDRSHRSVGVVRGFGARSCEEVHAAFAAGTAWPELDLLRV